MNSATVTNNNLYFMNVTNKGTSSKSTSGQDFTQVMDKTVNTGPTANSADAVQKKLNNAIIEKSKQNTVRDRVQESTDIKAADTDSNAEEAIESKAEELLGKVAEKLGVSEEEVIAAMEALGMQMSDLLNTDNMAQLVVQISGEADMMSLVTNGELYGKLTDLQQTVNTALTELQDDLSVTPEVLGGIIEKLSTATKSVMPMPETVPKDVKEVPEGAATAVIDEPADAMTKVAVKTGVDAAADADAANTNKYSDSNEVKQTVIVESKQEATNKTQKNQQTQVQEQSKTTDIEKPLEVGKEQNAAQEQSGNKDGAAENNQSFIQGLMNKTAAAAAQALENAVPLEKADTESIMKQMMDYVKLHLRANVTEMEIQLQPANLGSINLQVATRNGVITAQLTAETEAVKKAIESQVVQLRENLNEQGIKIEAVEVTIASHEFERNLDQGAQSEQSKESDQAKKANRKRIVLDEMDEAAEASLGDPDRIEVQMMKHNGNSVSLMA